MGLDFSAFRGQGTGRGASQAPVSSGGSNLDSIIGGIGNAFGYVGRGIGNGFSSLGGHFSSHKREYLRGLSLTGVVGGLGLAGYGVWLHFNKPKFDIGYVTPPSVVAPKPEPVKPLPEPTPVTPIPISPEFNGAIIGYAGNNVAVLPPPKDSTFVPEFVKGGNYKVHTPANLLEVTQSTAQSYGLKAGHYLVFDAGLDGIAEQSNIQAVGVNVTFDGYIVARGRANVGDKIYVAIPDNARVAIDSGRIGYQGMGLRQVGKSNQYVIAGSYDNGIFNKFNPTANGTGKTASASLDKVVDSYNAPDSALTAAINSYVARGHQLRATLPDSAAERTRQSLLEKYVADRNVDGNPIDTSTMGVWLSNLGDETVNVAKLYEESISQGNDHFKSLKYAAENAEIAAVTTSTDALEAIAVARDNGYNVTLGRWDSRLANQADVVAYVSQLEQQGLSTQEKLAQVKEQFGMSISKTTYAKYQNAANQTHSA